MKILKFAVAAFFLWFIGSIVIYKNYDRLICNYYDGTWTPFESSNTSFSYWLLSASGRCQGNSEPLIASIDWSSVSENPETSCAASGGRWEQHSSPCLECTMYQTYKCAEYIVPNCECGENKCQLHNASKSVCIENPPWAGKLSADPR